MYYSSIHCSGVSIVDVELVNAGWFKWRAEGELKGKK